MKLESIIFKTGSAIGHIASAGLAIDAINNITNGNYELGMIEGIASAYIQVSKYINRKEHNRIQNFLNKLQNEYIPKIKAIN